MAEASGEVGRLEPATVAQSFAVPPPGAANFLTALGPQSRKPKGVSGEPRHRACADGRPISELLLSAPREPAGACWKGDSGRDRAVCRDSAKAAWGRGADHAAPCAMLSWYFGSLKRTPVSGRCRFRGCRGRDTPRAGHLAPSPVHADLPRTRVPGAPGPWALSELTASFCFFWLLVPAGAGPGVPRVTVHSTTDKTSKCPGSPTSPVTGGGGAGVRGSPAASPWDPGRGHALPAR